MVLDDVTGRSSLVAGSIAEAFESVGTLHQDFHMAWSPSAAPAGCPCWSICRCDPGRIGRRSTARRRGTGAGAGASSSLAGTCPRTCHQLRNAPAHVGGSTEQERENECPAHLPRIKLSILPPVSMDPLGCACLQSSQPQQEYRRRVRHSGNLYLHHSRLWEADVSHNRPCDSSWRLYLSTAYLPRPGYLCSTSNCRVLPPVVIITIVTVVVRLLLLIFLACFVQISYCLAVSSPNTCVPLTNNGSAVSR